MSNISIETIEGNHIEVCRDLCNELMQFQKSQATMHSELFDLMNFDTRMKKSYEHAFRRQVIIAKDNETPIGYVFSTIDQIEQSTADTFPDWAPKGENYLGFFPKQIELPQTIGCLNNLYLRKEYQGRGLGVALLDQAMAWLESFPDTHLNFVYISNGNKNALDFYLKHGFTYSHDVFGGFITAAYKRKKQ